VILLLYVDDIIFTGFFISCPATKLTDNARFTNGTQ